MTTPLVNGKLFEYSPQISGEPPDVDDINPDIIPNHHGKKWLHASFKVKSTIHNIFFHSERRPPKATLPTPLFRSPSARGIQRDVFIEERNCDELSLTSLIGLHTDVQPYLFKSSKQIVSHILNLFYQKISLYLSFLTELFIVRTKWKSNHIIMQSYMSATNHWNDSWSHKSKSINSDIFFE